MTIVAAVPFTLRRRSSQTTSDPVWTRVQTERTAVGIARLEEDALVLQLRERAKVITTVPGGETRVTTESDLRDVRIPLAGIRSARIERRWWRTRLVLAAADLRAFESLPASPGGELALRVARRDRTDAEELAAQVEYAMAQRLLSPPDLDRFPSILPTG